MNKQMNDKSIATSKHYIKHVRIIDNTGYENYLNTVDVYGVLEIMVGDIATYYRLDIEAPYKEGMWVTQKRCSDVCIAIMNNDTHINLGDKDFTIEIDIPHRTKKSLEDAYDEPVIPTFDSKRLKETLEKWAIPNWRGGYIPSYAPNPLTPKQTVIDKQIVKPNIERVICIPDEDGHIVDLQRIQYISPLNGKFVDDDSYIVTLVSGWEIKLMDKVYSREKLLGLWRGLQNK